MRKTLAERNAYQRAYRKKNKEIVNAINRRYRARNRKRVRGWELRSRHAKLGMPAPTRPCPARCECCGRKPKKDRSLHLDHDHETGKFRGWLCIQCNSGIGSLGDSIAGLKAGIKYLESNT